MADFLQSDVAKAGFCSQLLLAEFDPQPTLGETTATVQGLLHLIECCAWDPRLLPDRGTRRAQFVIR